MKDNNNPTIYAIVVTNSFIDTKPQMINEFISLVYDAGYEPAFHISQKVEIPHSATYLGRGFVDKIREHLQYIYGKNEEFIGKTVVACGFDLTGTQRANLKKILGVEVIDRTFIILKIFENHAHTKEAKLQVDIASLTWSKNHLVNAEGAFSQVTSGGGLHNKGSGEKQIVLDRRHINNLILTKKRELEHIQLARKNSRTKRNNSGVYKIAIVGYTNAGKSTLMNHFVNFSGGEKTVVSKNELFVTVETSTREIYKYGYMKFFLTDTVGFVRNLPTTLIEAFKSTLEEINEADLLVHVVDFSDSEYLEHIQTTEEILKEIGVDNIPTIYLYSKFDLIEKPIRKLLQDNEMYCSLVNSDDIEEIYHFICSHLSKDWEEVKIEFPYEGDYASFSADNYVISSFKNKNGYSCTVRINPRTKFKYNYLLDRNS